MPSIYDHPLYYDILFGWDRSGEAKFYDRLFRTHDVPARGRVIEIACGTGQVAIHLAELGWRVTGLDVRPEMLNFLREASSRHSVAIQTICADMTDFEVRQEQEAAFCPFGSFHLLADEDSALAHLEAVAEAITPEGIYALDLTLGDDEGNLDTTIKPWTMKRGSITVQASAAGIVATDEASGQRLDLDWGGEIRRYTVADFRALISTTDSFAFEVAYPEHRQAPDGSTVFDVQRSVNEASPGRSIIVLRRR